MKVKKEKKKVAAKKKAVKKVAKKSYVSLAELAKQCHVKYHSIYMIPERRNLAEKIEIAGEEVIAFSKANADKIRESIAKPMKKNLSPASKVEKALHINRYMLTKLIKQLGIKTLKLRREKDNKPVIAIPDKMIPKLKKAIKEM